MSLNKEKRSYPFGVKLATVRIVKAQTDWKEVEQGKRRRLSLDTMTLARAASGGASDDAIRKWMNSNIDEDPDIAEKEEKERLSLRGAKLKFEPDFQALLVGHAIHRRLSFRAVNAQDLIDFARGTFGINIVQQRISEILIAYGFSSQLSMGRNSRMTDEKVAEDCVAFILELRVLLKAFKKLMVMDETGLWSNVVARLTYHFRNLYELQLLLKILPNCEKTVNCLYFPFHFSSIWPTLNLSFRDVF